MSVLKYFKNTPRSPPIGRQALYVIFFLKICNEIPGRKKMKGGLSPPSGDHWAPPTGAAGGPVAPPLGRPGLPPLYKHSTPITSSFKPKNSTKNPEKKRGVRRREEAKPCRIPHL